MSGEHPDGHVRGHEPEVIVILDARSGELVEAIVDGPCATCYLAADIAYERVMDR